MRKQIILLTLFFSGLLLTTAGSVWAISSSSEATSSKIERSLKVRSNAVGNLGEVKERAKTLFESRGMKATPPGILRQKESTVGAKINLLRPHVYMGTVSGILTANKAFTLTTVKNGLKTVQTNEETKFIKGKWEGGLRGSFESLKVGDRVIAVGRIDSDGIMAARFVIVIGGAKDSQPKRRAVYGVAEQKIASDSATRLMLKHPNNDKKFEVLVTAQTKITGKGLTNATVNDIKIGNRVTAVGTVDGKGVITAKHLHIIPGLARGLMGATPSATATKSGR